MVSALSLRRLLARILCAAAAVMIGYAPAAAEPAEPAPAALTAAPVAAHELTATDIESFLDGLIPLQIETNDIAGATVAVVKDGKLLFAKGYGFADMATRAPVSAETTLFRTGSVTKLFTWTAVMQLVEQGKADLDADVNTYLDFELPAPHGKPVTLRNLLTHRPGFEEIIKGLGAQNTGKIDLAAYCRDRIPAQIFEPGTTPSYSNYGAALAGCIVERISGEPFDAYVEEHIFKPLGMTQSTLRQPLPKDLAPHMSAGYLLASGDAQPFEMVNAYPAGSMSASATDMAKFMIAHLSGGALGEGRILKPETVALMHDTVTTLDPAQNGIALGFYEESRNGHRIIGHGGDSVLFHSDLHLVPDVGLGFFVSYNSQGRGDSAPRNGLWRKFMDRYFPDTRPKVARIAEAKAAADAVAGSYITTRRQESSVFKMLSALGQSVVTARDDGTIEVSGFTGLNGQPRRFEPVGPSVFQEVNGRDRLVFTKDGRMVSWGGGVVASERVDDLHSQNVLLLVFAVSLGIVALNVLLTPIAAVTRWHYRRPLDWSAGEKLLKWAGLATSIAFLVMLIGLGVILVPTLQSPWSLDGSLDPTIHTLQYIGYAAAAGTLLVVWNAVQSWSSEARSIWGRLKEAVLALACVGLVWFLWSMQLLDLGLRY